MGRFARALDYYEQAIEIDREIGDKVGLTLDLANLSECYGRLGKTIEAMGCFDEALAVSARLLIAGLRWQSIRMLAK